MEDDKGRAKRPHKRTFQSLLNHSKVKHLKKRDGEPLWRADLQYDFLYGVFTNDKRVFTNSYTGEQGQTFADVYIDAMARSSKCSKVLGEKLLGDRTAAISIAMVCLLVNLGRMNTTLNFFPEMKAQLRTYHPIPSLQNQDTAEYKQLQDAPRLKSILKGACEDRKEPLSFDELRKFISEGRQPPTNPVNLVFLMSTFSSEVETRFMSDPHNFFSLIMDKTLSSSSRVQAFLWLVWAYLESGFTPSGLAQNPFGPVAPEERLQVPPLVPLNDKGVKGENIDTPAEIAFGNQMTLQRLAYLHGTVTSSAGSRPTSNVSQVNTEQENKQLTIPRPRNARERRVQSEFERLLKEKRHRRQIRRRARRDPVKDLWERINSVDALYDSSSSLTAREDATNSPNMKAAGLQDQIGDYGEHVSAILSTLRNISNKK